MKSTSLSFAVAFTAFTTAQLFAQATQPTVPSATAVNVQAVAASDWAATVERFTTSLVNGDVPTARAMTAELTVVRAGSTEQIDLATVVQRSHAGALLGAHAYVYPPIALAADIAADVKGSPVVTESTKALLIPEDDAAMTRANATAMQWVAQALGATKGTPVAIAIIMPGATNESTGKIAAPLLILMRGAPATDGIFHVNRIVFGTPPQIVE